MRYRNKLIISIILLIIPIYLTIANIIALVFLYAPISNVIMLLISTLFPEFTEHANLIIALTYFFYVQYGLPTFFITWICPFINMKLLRFFWTSWNTGLPIDAEVKDDLQHEREVLSELAEIEKINLLRDKLLEESHVKDGDKPEFFSIEKSKKYLSQIFHFFVRYKSRRLIFCHLARFFSKILHCFKIVPRFFLNFLRVSARFCLYFSWDAFPVSHDNFYHLFDEV
ncbi:MAG: hypothetical protein ACTSXP_03585 [Promethearchaeota archaeon]